MNMWFYFMSFILGIISTVVFSYWMYTSHIPARNRIIPEKADIDDTADLVYDNEIGHLVLYKGKDALKRMVGIMIFIHPKIGGLCLQLGNFTSVKRKFNTLKKSKLLK